VALGALLLSVATLVAPISHAGIWEPRELEVAELSRRIGAGLFGTPWLRDGADPAELPTLGDLRSGELPFVAIAAAFRLFGLHPYAGRLAMCVFAIAGIVATWRLLARFAGPRAAILGALVLASTPLYAVHARTMLGDAAAMSAFAVAFSGLAGLVLEGSTKRAIAWAPIALAGLIGGYLARGLLFGVAVPLVAIGMGALLVVSPLGRDGAQRRVMIGCSALALGLASVVTFLQHVHGLRAIGSDAITRVTALALEATPSGATFETAARRLAHALFPWSALVPLAVGRALAVPSPDAPAPGEAPRRAESASLRLLVLVAAGVALAASSLVAPFARDAPFVGAAAVSALVALAFDDLVGGATPSRVAAFATVVLIAILGFDLAREPARNLAMVGGESSSFPESSIGLGKAWVVATAAAVGIGAAIAASIDPRGAPAGGPPAIARAARDDARALLRAVASAWGGNLAFLLVVVEAALVGLAAMVVVGRAAEWSSILRLPELYQRAFLHLFWLVPLGVAFSVAVPTVGADALRAVARRAGTRAAGLAVALAVLGALAFVVGFHPELAAQLSPREALEAFARMHRDREPLGLLRMSPRLVAYHGGGDVRAFGRTDDAFAWLAGDDQPPESAVARRWLVVPESELAKLNVLHRQRFGRNLPVADASSSRTLLAVSDLEGMVQRSPLRDVVLDEPREPARRAHARFEEGLELLGWEVVDADGARLEAVPTRTAVNARFYVRVSGAIDPGYAPFLHVDRGKLRFNGDAAFVDHGYGPAHWLAGDVVVLTCAVLLEANFPIGEADVYFGFFSGATRMKVTGGAASQNRAKLGKLRVR
jgi:hypothetical protein